MTSSTTSGQKFIKLLRICGGLKSTSCGFKTFQKILVDKRKTLIKLQRARLSICMIMYIVHVRIILIFIQGSWHHFNNI